MISPDYVLCYIPRAMAILGWKWKFWSLLVRRRRPLWYHWRPLCGFGNFGNKFWILEIFPKFWIFSQNFQNHRGAATEIKGAAASLLVNSKMSILYHPSKLSLSLEIMCMHFILSGPHIYLQLYATTYMVPQIFERFVSITKKMEFFLKFIQFGSPTCPQVWRYKFGKTSFAYLCFLIFSSVCKKS